MANLTCDAHASSVLIHASETAEATSLALLRSTKNDDKLKAASSIKKGHPT